MCETMSPIGKFAKIATEKNLEFFVLFQIIRTLQKGFLTEQPMYLILKSIINVGILTIFHAQLTPA